MWLVGRIGLCALYIALIGIAMHPIGILLQRYPFKTDKAPWRSFAWEDGGRVWRKIGVHKWKDRLPDMSKIMPDMVRKEIAFSDGTKQLDALITETCIAELVHYALMLLSAGVLWILPNGIGFLIWALCILGNLPFAIIQRYNRPRLIKARARRKHE